MNHEQLVSALAEIVGPERVRSEGETLAAYADDLTENEPHLPRAVVKPVSVPEIQALVRLAQANCLPLTPRVANTNVGGLAIPAEGGIVVDLQDMRRIWEVNSEALYVLLEPGVTFADLKQHLEANHPDLIAAYPLSPPYASVLCNCLLDGLANLSFRHGSTATLINGLEVVLPTGEVVRTGAAAASGCWFSRAPLPDLTGLFVSWQGTTGIVTKMAVQLWPRPAYRRRFFLLAPDLASAFQFQWEAARTGLFDDLGGTSWPLGRLLFGLTNVTQRDPHEPEFYLYGDFSALTEDEMKAKQKVLDALLAAARAEGTKFEGPLDVELLIQVEPSLRRFAEFPLTLDFVLDHPGGGLTWMGTYGPLATWLAGAERGQEILLRRGFPPMFVTRVMQGGRYAVLRFILLFDKRNPAEIQRVRQVNRELLTGCLELGFVPYKLPAWAARELRERFDAGFVGLMDTLKRTLDPQGIMNPGRWWW